MIKKIFLISFFLFFLFLFFNKKQNSVIKKIKEEKNYLIYQIKDKKGQIIEAVYYFSNPQEKNKINIGDSVIVEKHKNPNDKESFYIADFDRTKIIFSLFIIFVLFVFLVAGKKSINAFLSLIITFLILFFSIIPNILSGANPFLATMIGGLLIIPSSYFFSHGFNKKSLSAVFGSIISLGVSLGLALFYTHMAKISGVSEETNFIKIITQKDYNFQGIFFASIILGLLAVLDDVTINQAAIVEKLIDNPKTSFMTIYQKAIEIGQDHINSIINTLVLVYASASLPLLLLFSISNKNFLELVNYEVISQEIIRTLIGTIGVIIAIPLTTFFAVKLYKK